MSRFPITAWECLDTQEHADCRVYRILRERWRNVADKTEGEFYVMDVADWAVCLALTELNTCVLVRQFRFGSAAFSWELPAGLVDAGEAPLDAGIRELYEESGYRGSRAEVLGWVYPNPAIQRNRCHFVLVREARRTGDGDPDPHETFEIEERSLQDLFSWAREGRIRHGIVHAALFFLREHLLREGFRSEDF
ncbi:MAG: NUDIX hydrolase [Oceanipulchritudo sp.]